MRLFYNYLRARVAIRQTWRAIGAAKPSPRWRTRSNKWRATQIPTRVSPAPSKWATSPFSLRTIMKTSKRSQSLILAWWSRPISKSIATAGWLKNESASRWLNKGLNQWPGRVRIFSSPRFRQVKTTRQKYCRIKQTIRILQVLAMIAKVSHHK